LYFSGGMLSYSHVMKDKKIERETITLNGRVYVVNNDPKHQRRQRAGYYGRNPKWVVRLMESIGITTWPPSQRPTKSHQQSILY